MIVLILDEVLSLGTDDLKRPTVGTFPRNPKSESISGVNLTFNWRSANFCQVLSVETPTGTVAVPYFLFYFFIMFRFKFQYAFSDIRWNQFPTLNSAILCPHETGRFNSDENYYKISHTHTHTRKCHNLRFERNGKTYNIFQRMSDDEFEPLNGFVWLPILCGSDGKPFRHTCQMIDFIIDLDNKYRQYKWNCKLKREFRHEFTDNFDYIPLIPILYSYPISSFWRLFLLKRQLTIKLIKKIKLKARSFSVTNRHLVKLIQTHHKISLFWKIITFQYNPLANKIWVPFKTGNDYFIRGTWHLCKHQNQIIKHVDSQRFTASAKRLFKCVQSGAETMKQIINTLQFKFKQLSSE